MGATTLRPSAASSSAPKTSAPSSKVSCGKCRRMGHSSGECPFEGTLSQMNAAKEDEDEMKLTSVAFASVAECERHYKEVEEKFGRCFSNYLFNRKFQWVEYGASIMKLTVKE